MTRTLNLALIACLAMVASGSVAAQQPLAYASGSWFDPQRNGEGFVVQVIPDARAIVTWFTYPPEGEDADQAWMIGVGTVEESRIVIEEMERPVGARFGPEFDPGDVVREAWGSLEIVFEGCNSATASWSGPPEFGDGSMGLKRLTSIDDVTCEGAAAPVPDRVIAGRSGAWFDPGHDGEGWMLEMLPDGNMVVYWFTYDEQGRQAWMLGVAKVEGRTLWIEELVIPRGARFGQAFHPEDVAMEPWGSFGFLFEDCDNAKMRYRSADPRFAEGVLEPVRLAHLVGTDCSEPAPLAPLTAGTWHQAGDTPNAQSETASVGLNGYVYTGGGFSDFTRFERYDPVSDAYQALPDLPGPRHHPMLTTDGQYIYLAGGYASVSGKEGPGTNFWRFDPVAGAWESLPDMPIGRAAGAAVYLANHIWIVGGEGFSLSFQSYDIENGEWGTFPGDARMILDHMQAVVFENEIWWLGGRADKTYNRVLIWNPVSREWREGPSMIFPRAGLAAKVVQGQIMAAGGEILDSNPVQVVNSMEIFAPGAESWVVGPRPPVAVHGTTGAAANGEFLLIGGSTDGGGTSQNRSTQVYVPAAAGSP